MQNIRTLCQRSPMFLVFRPKMAQKCLFSDFTIFRSKARLGGFRGRSQPVNDVVQQAGGFRKRTLKKYCTLVRFPKIRRLVLRNHPYSDLNVKRKKRHSILNSLQNAVALIWFHLLP